MAENDKKLEDISPDFACATGDVGGVELELARLLEGQLSTPSQAFLKKPGTRPYTPEDLTQSIVPEGLHNVAR